MTIKQIYISPTLEKTFGENFRIKWNLSKYNNINEPSVFMGIYTQYDLETLMNHKNIKIVIWGGADMRENALRIVKNLVEIGECFTFAYPGEFSDILDDYDIKHKSFFLEVKDYSKFIPNCLGNKIYVYKGISGNRPDYFKWNDIIVPLIKHFGERNIIYTNNQSEKELKNFYDQSFVYIKPKFIHTN